MVAFAILHVGVTFDGDDNVTVAVDASIFASVVPVIVNVYTELEHEPAFTAFNVISHVDNDIKNNKYMN